MKKTMNNKRVKLNKTEILSDNWYTLKKIDFDYQRNDGSWQNQKREVYDRGNGAAVLLFNETTKKVILTRQFRMPAYVNGDTDGMLIEVCAGLLDELNPEACIIKEIEEETGYRVPSVKKVFEALMSPGAVTEILHFFIAKYDDGMKVNEGGGNPEETENIEVLEVGFTEALKLMEEGKIRDAKTIMLLQYAQLHLPLA
jgi:GDP-mannose pyrophosphatase NudK